MTKNPEKAFQHARHSRKCFICNHPNRDAIEADFLHWSPGASICNKFAISSRSVLYRHADATGLLRRRRLNLRGACERTIERFSQVPPSARTIVNAVRIFSQIDDNGRWIGPATRSKANCENNLTANSSSQILIGTPKHCARTVTS